MADQGPVERLALAAESVESFIAVLPWSHPATHDRGQARTWKQPRGRLRGCGS